MPRADGGESVHLTPNLRLSEEAFPPRRSRGESPRPRRRTRLARLRSGTRPTRLSLESQDVGVEVEAEVGEPAIARSATKRRGRGRRARRRPARPTSPSPPCTAVRPIRSRSPAASAPARRGAARVRYHRRNGLERRDHPPPARPRRGRQAGARRAARQCVPTRRPARPRPHRPHRRRSREAGLPGGAAASLRRARIPDLARAARHSCRTRRASVTEVPVLYRPRRTRFDRWS